MLSISISDLFNPLYWYSERAVLLVHCFYIRSQAICQNVTCQNKSGSESEGDTMKQTTAGVIQHTLSLFSISIIDIAYNKRKAEKVKIGSYSFKLAHTEMSELLQPHIKLV